MFLRSASRIVSRHGRTAAPVVAFPSVTSSGPIRNLSAQVDEKDEAPTKSHSEQKPTRPAAPDLPVDFSDISRAMVAIRGGIRRTECVKSYFLSELIGANIYLKPEFQQFTGSFKERGARNAILQLMREHGSSLNGVIAASAGNHALALAYHGKELGVPVTVVMPVVAPLAKVDKCRVRSKTAFHGDFPEIRLLNIIF